MSVFNLNKNKFKKFNLSTCKIVQKSLLKLVKKK